jgi:hypothetical protein
MTWDWVTFVIGVIVGALLGIGLPLILAAIGSDHWEE